jgi:flagellar basal body-associated protein FliL
MKLASLPAAIALRRRLERRVPQSSRLPLALGIAIVVALVLTVVSVAIYSRNGSSKLDLSRPGYERERQEVRQTEPQKTYDTTSPVTKGAIDEFLTEYDQRIKDLSQYGDFRDQPLSDSELQITPTQ